MFIFCDEILLYTSLNGLFFWVSVASLGAELSQRTGLPLSASRTAQTARQQPFADADASNSTSGIKPTK